MINISQIQRGDSIYVKGKGLISDMIVYVSTGGKTKYVPSHEAKVYSIIENRVKLIEVVFSGQRFYWLDDYIKKGVKVWIKREELNDNKINRLLVYLENIDVQKYDWGLIAGFLARFILRKIFPRKWNFNWVTKIWDSKISFICSEYINSGRRAIGMNVKENETPYDDWRKIPALDIITFNV